ncbi:hypothetical protein [Enterococcus rivorum]|uniref:hypothetical protein n=1 Tax=Enterococcus rivorum TaxID=762845 RepID=UPI001B805C9D|nr:hypothetical protein [Enterococcus rivorum]
MEGKRPPKKKKKARQRWNRKKKKLSQKQNRIGVTVISCFLISLACGAGSTYGLYYQSTHLKEKDSEAVIQGYVLLSELSKEVAKVPETEKPEKVQTVIYDLAARLASYGARRADGRLGSEEQQLLNRLYSNMKELGLNIGAQSIDHLKDPEIYEDYQKDIQKTKTNQKKVLDHFRVSQKDLEKLVK